MAIANSNLDRYGNIRALTSAILFIATPHRGSKDAALLANIAAVGQISLAGMGLSRVLGGIRIDLIKDLTQNESVVTKITEEFEPMTDGSIRLYSFIEDLATTPLNARVSPLMRSAKYEFRKD